MPDEFDPFQPGTGLKDDFDATVTDAMFDVDTTARRGSITLTLDEDYTIRYGIGSDWDTYDAGLSVQHPGGARTSFNANTAYSDFMVHAMESGARDEMYRINKVYENRGPQFAKMWVGMRFHWNVQQRPSRQPLNNEDGTPKLDESGRQEWGNTTISRTLPTKFLGVEGQQTLTGVGSATPVGTLGAPSATTSTDPLNVLDTATQYKVRKAAREATDYNSFVDSMLQLTDSNDVAIMDHDGIGQALADEGWFEGLRVS